MSPILNDKLSGVYQKNYEIRSNFVSLIFEDLAIECVFKFGATAAIINFIYAGQNLFLLVFKRNEEAYREMEVNNIPRLTNPMLAAEMGLKFYASSPLFAENLLAIGTICLIDSITRTFSKKQQVEFNAIASQISMKIVELNWADDGNEHQEDGLS